MEAPHMAALKYTTMELGGRCAMTSGTKKMLMWFVVSWVSPEQHLLHTAQSMVKGLSLRGWMIWNVLEQRLHCLIAHIMAGEMRTVATVRMQA